LVSEIRMSDKSDLRRWSEVLSTDPDLAIYIATVDDLVRISGEAKLHLWGANGPQKRLCGTR
jgi:hypothetical protein